MPPRRKPQAEIVSFPQRVVGQAMQVGVTRVAETYRLPPRAVFPLWVGMQQDALTLTLDILVLYLFTTEGPRGGAVTETQGVHFRVDYETLRDGGREPEPCLLHWHGQFTSPAVARLYADRTYKSESTPHIIAKGTPRVPD